MNGLVMSPISCGVRERIVRNTPKYEFIILSAASLYLPLPNEVNTSCKSLEVIFPALAI